MQHSIVCGVDGSQPSRSAVRVAARLARTLDSRFVLAHATEDRPTFPYRDRRLGELQRRRAIEDGQRLLEDVAAGLSGILPETRVVLAAPVEGLSAVCREESAELLIVGSRGRGALRAAVLGSVSGTLAATAPLPVLVVPPTARPIRQSEASADGSDPEVVPGARRWNAGSTKERHMNDQTTTQRAARRQQIGRFSEGMERLPRTPTKLRRGSFADGYDEVP